MKIKNLFKTVILNLEFKYKLKFKYKLLLLYFGFILIPLLIFSMFSYLSISRWIEKEAKYSAEQLLSQSSALLENKIDTILYTSDQVFLDKNLHETLEKDMYLPLGPKLIKDYSSITELLTKMYNTNKITLYINDNIYYSHENRVADQPVSFSSLKVISKESWYKQISDFNGKILWIPLNSNGHNVVSGLRLIKNLDNLFDVIAILKVDLLESDLNTILKKANSSQNGIAYIQNSKGVILVSSNPELLTKYKLETSASKPFEFQDGKWNVESINHKSVLVGSTHIKNTDWTMVSILPFKEIISSNRQIRNLMVVFVLITLIMSLTLVYAISVDLTKRINSLTTKMKKVQNGDFTSIMEVRGNDEMTELIDNYNYTLDKLQGFSTLYYEAGLEVKNAELKALQAQINPHFLYNTLELINWTAIENNVPEISDIIQALGKFYKLTLSNGADIVTITDEISHIELYVKLQNFRFKDKITLIVDLDERLYKYSIIKLLLQPIVENSILHGILEKASKAGTIIIIGQIDESSNIITLTIEDDGIGMTEEQIAKLLSNTEMVSSDGYGIKNVNYRMKIRYGEEYGLTYKSILGEGTIVYVKFPSSIK